jgi:large subunit ribosomal protein L9
MKVFMRKDVPQVGMAGTVVKVTDGYARNFLFPQGFAVEVTLDNEGSFTQRAHKLDVRKEVIATKTSILGEKIKATKIVLKRKMHDDGKLYGAVSPHEIVDLLGEKGISVSKSQIIFDKSIKAKGLHTIIIQLTSKLQASLSLEIVSE